MYSNEAAFEVDVISVLSSNRENIAKQYQPIKTLKYRVDVKSIFNNIEEWRELKIIYYKDKSKSIQNLWKGFGKVILLQDLASKTLAKPVYPIVNILTIPEFDFNNIPRLVINSIISITFLEKLIDGNPKELTMVT